MPAGAPIPALLLAQQPAAARRKSSTPLPPWATQVETLAGMEPNTAAGRTSPETVVEQDMSTTHAQSLLSPPSFFQPPPPPPEGLVPAYGSGSVFPAVGYGSISDGGHAASSSTFPAPGEVHMTGGDICAQQEAAPAGGQIFPNVEAPAANPALPTAFGGEPWQGPEPQPSSSWAAPGMRAAFPVEEAFLGLAAGCESALLLEQIATWEWQSEMAPSLVPPPSAGSGLPPPSSGGGGSAQPSSSDYELPPLPESLRIPPPMEASTYNYNMPSTIDASMMMMPWYCGAGSSSMDVDTTVSSLPDLTIGAMDEDEAPMLPVMPPPSFQGAGASSNIAQPSSNSEVAPAPAPASLQAPLVLPAKQEPVDDDRAPHCDPVLLLLDEDEENNLPVQEPDNPTAMSQSSETASKLPEESGYNVSDSTTVPVDGWSTPSQDPSKTKDTINSSSSLSAIGGNTNTTSGLPPPPPLIRAAGSNSHSDPKEVTFDDAELEILWKDKNLQELVYTDPKKVKRTIVNRISFAKRKALKEKYTHELEGKVKALETKRSTVITKLLLLQKECGELATQNMEMGTMAHELEQQEKLKDAVRESLQAEIRNLNLIMLNKALQTNPEMMMDGNNVSGAHDLHQQMSTQITTATGSVSHVNNDVDQRMSPQMVQLQQLQTLEPQSEHQEVPAQESQDEDDFLLGGHRHQDT